MFTGDDFDLKISDKAHPNYLAIANDPEKGQVIGSLNALVLNRLITRVNSMSNIPVSIIVDELPQLESDYGKVEMSKIMTTCCNIFMGAARDFTATDDVMLNHFDIEQSEEFKTTKYFCKTHFDMKKLKDEEDHNMPLPKIYEFKNDRKKEIMLNRNFKRVNEDVDKMVKELQGMA